MIFLKIQLKLEAFILFYEFHSICGRNGTILDVPNVHSPPHFYVGIYTTPIPVFLSSILLLSIKSSKFHLVQFCWFAKCFYESGCFLDNFKTISKKVAKKVNK